MSIEAQYIYIIWIVRYANTHRVYLFYFHSFILKRTFFLQFLNFRYKLRFVRNKLPILRSTGVMDQLGIMLTGDVRVHVYLDLQQMLNGDRFVTAFSNTHCSLWHLRCETDIQICIHAAAAGPERVTLGLWQWQIFTTAVVMDQLPPVVRVLIRAETISRVTLIQKNQIMCLEESFCPFTRDALNFRQPKIYAALPSSVHVVLPQPSSLRRSIILLSYRSCSPEKQSPLK